MFFVIAPPKGESLEELRGLLVRGDAGPGVYTLRPFHPHVDRITGVKVGPEAVGLECASAIHVLAVLTLPVDPELGALPFKIEIPVCDYGSRVATAINVLPLQGCVCGNEAR